MKRWSLLVPLVLTMPVLAAGEDKAARPSPPQRVAVLEFDLAGGVQIDRLYFSDKVRGVVGRQAPHLFVMTRESAEAILQGFGQSLSDCTGECEVEIGRKLNADYVIGGRITKVGTRLSLTLKLHATADGRLLGTEEAVGKDVDELVDATAAAVTPLLTRLDQKAAREVVGLPPVPPLPPPPTFTIEIESDPPGAVVSLDGQEACTSTPCSLTVKQGQHSLVAGKEGYKPAEHRIDARLDSKITFKLTRLVGTLSVASQPAGLVVALDGKQAGKTPLKLADIGVGPHVLVIDDSCFTSEPVKVELKTGETLPVPLAPKPRTAPVQLSAADESGAALKGEGLADEAVLGPVPGSYKLPVCTKAVRVRVAEAAAARSVQLADGKSAALSLTVPVARCSKVRGWNKAMGWVTGVAVGVGAAGMGGAVALQQSARNAAAGDSGTHSKVMVSKTLNVAGLATLGVGAAGLLTWLFLPSSVSACEAVTP